MEPNTAELLNNGDKTPTMEDLRLLLRKRQTARPAGSMGEAQQARIKAYLAREVQILQWAIEEIEALGAFVDAHRAPVANPEEQVKLTDDDVLVLRALRKKPEGIYYSHLGSAAFSVGNLIGRKKVSVPKLLKLGFIYVTTKEQKVELSSVVRISDTGQEWLTTNHPS